MPFDPQRLARVRAHLLTAIAVTAAGCGGNTPPDHTVNEPVHINPPPDSASQTPSAAPTLTASPEIVPHTINVAPQLNPAPSGSAAPAPSDTDKKPDPKHINTPMPPHKL